MHKFIRSNKNPNTHIFVTEYNWPIEEKLKGRAIVVKISNLDNILSIKRNIDEATKIEAFVYRNDFASLETIDLNPAWGDTPIILYINRLGQFRDVCHKIELLRRLNVIVIFTAQQNIACKDAQILSSLGIHSGIQLCPDSELSDSLLDLMTYHFYGTMPHAPIEPFASLERYYDGENYVSPTMTNFVNPERYIHIDKDMNMAFSEKQLAQGDTLPLSFPHLKSEMFAQEAQKQSLKWQEMFVDSHPCTFCPAFRVCMGFFANPDGTHAEKCKEVMSEMLESIEDYKSRLQQNKKSQCQL
ncbi:MAG: hypothetical protein ACI31F_01510 [Muribaculaceae bacterium]